MSNEVTLDADLNDNGMIESVDAVLILQIVAGLIQLLALRFMGSAS